MHAEAQKRMQKWVHFYDPYRALGISKSALFDAFCVFFGVFFFSNPYRAHAYSRGILRYFRVSWGRSSGPDPYRTLQKNTFFFMFFSGSRYVFRKSAKKIIENCVQDRILDAFFSRYLPRLGSETGVFFEFLVLKKEGNQDIELNRQEERARFFSYFFVHPKMHREHSKKV